MEFQQRDIVLVHFPFTDLTATKLRPALIISSVIVNKQGDFVCAQITSKILNDVPFFTIHPEMLETALPLTSGVRTQKLFCLSEKLIVHKISSMKTAAFDQLLYKIDTIVFGVNK